jgi:D-alanyl-D-alanine carboxypeptidase/D-alanyl-D-alanine-endopeptidase (penicillin-binding protein 4)
MAPRAGTTAGVLAAGLVLLWLACVSIAAATPQFAELQRLAATHLGADQGVFVESENGTVLVAQQEARAVHPASVTKVATSLALLERLGPDHRFETRLLASGPVRGGSLEGDLVVEASGDPFLVFENALLILCKLEERGVLEVRGDLKVHGRLMFNWKPDPDGRRLKRALEGLDGGAARSSVAKRCSPPKGLRFLAQTSEAADERVLLAHRSPPLLTIIKALNGYSNNIFHPLSEEIGGPRAVEAGMQAHLPLDMRGEVILTNAAGAGDSNRLSPRAAVRILWRLRQELMKHGADLPSALPVNGIDAGTLRNRLDEASYRGGVVGKTGTFGSVGATALAGVLRTRKHGYVAFAVLNSWIPVPEARRRQDAFLRALMDATAAEAWEYVATEKPIFAEAEVE